MTYRLPARFLIVVALLVWTSTVAAAQDPDTDDLLAPPHLSIVDGAANLDRDGALVAAEIGQILAAGDRLTTRGGRVEILFGDGSALHLDERTTIDLLDEDLIRLVEGRAYLHVAPSEPPFEYRIDTPAASIRTAVAGEYRIMAGPVSELAVARGLASISTTAGSLALRSGEVIQVRYGEAPGFAMPFNAAAWDPFDRWSQDRRRPRVASITSAPLQGPLTPYNATLSQHGTWSQHADHGHVWYPHVPGGWRPFYNGRWTTLAPYGWVWAGGDPWAWPTHYYGSWGVTHAGAWFWIPGARWRPAAVHWTVTSTHVGWLPWGAGLDVFGFTVIPRTVFAVNVIVPRHVVRVSHTALRPLAIAQSPPLPRGFVGPRAFGAHRRPAIFASRAPATRVAQPRRGPSALVEAAVGGNARTLRDRDRGRPAAATSQRRAVDRSPGSAGSPPIREQSAFRDQPALMPRRDDAEARAARLRSAYGGAPQPESRTESRPEPRVESRSAPRSDDSGARAARLRSAYGDSSRPEPRTESRPEPRSAPRSEAPQRAPREAAPAPSSRGDSSGERRAVERAPGSGPRRSRD
jgi:hypothetical protein